MKQILLVANLMLAAAFLATAQKTPESMLGAALHQEEVQGDLKGAIAAYQKVVATPGVSRKTAAAALVRMGQCYEKLGDAESGKIYQRVLRDYADQKEAVTLARARLESIEPMHQTGGILTRQVWAGPKVSRSGGISPDGRYLSFTDGSTGNLALRDLANGADRALTNKGSFQDSPAFAEKSAVSRDGKQVAYAWFNGKDHYELRTIPLQGRPFPAPRHLYDNADVQWLAPYDWSPDNKWIAVQLSRKDGTTSIGLVSAADGSLKPLKSVDWRGPGKIAFSPDGKFVAYDIPVSDSSSQRDVFVLAVDGSRETAAVAHPADDLVIGWSPDGKLLLFSSYRTGAFGLWSVAMSDGKPQSGPKLIKADLGRGVPLGISASGSLYFGSKVGGPDIQIASIDFSKGQLLSPPVNPVPFFTGSNQHPHWSTDGKYLAYVSRRDIGGGLNVVLCILSINTGDVRELKTPMGYVSRPRWSPDGRFLAVTGTDLKGRRGLFRIDAQNGAASPLALSEPGGSIEGIDWSPDGNNMYFARSVPGKNGSDIVERDLVSGRERVVIHRDDFLYAGLASLSPDGAWIASRAQDPSTKASVLLAIPVEGGETREILRAPEGLGAPGWAPDSRSVFVQKFGNNAECVRVPISGGEAARMDFFVGGGTPFSVHPDGRQVAYWAGGNAAEVWVLENFLPALSASK